MNTKWLLLDYLLLFCFALVLGLFIGRVTFEIPEPEEIKREEKVMFLNIFGVSFELPPSTQDLTLGSNQYVAEELSVKLIDHASFEMEISMQELFKLQRLLPIDDCVVTAARGGTPEGEHLLVASDGVRMLQMQGRRMYVDRFIAKICDINNIGHYSTVTDLARLRG